MCILCSVSALLIGAPGSEWILLPKRAAAFWEGHKKSSALFQKICWEEPEKQKPRNCRAQELSRSSTQWRGLKRKQCTETASNRGDEDRSHKKKVRQAVRTLPLARKVQRSIIGADESKRTWDIPAKEVSHYEREKTGLLESHQSPCGKVL
jgi:hypothetical protein